MQLKRCFITQLGNILGYKHMHTYYMNFVKYSVSNINLIFKDK